MMRQVFWDCWGFAAIADRGDPGHRAAVSAARWLRGHAYRIVTTDYVLDEAFTWIRAVLGQTAALAFAGDLDRLVAAGTSAVELITPARWQEARRRFEEIDGSLPRLSFTDCTSFVVMEELGVSHAFTADRHFFAAGGLIRPVFRRGAKGRVVVDLPAA